MVQCYVIFTERILYMINVRSCFGDRQFYKKVLAIAVPIMIQNGITNLVNMLDNVMIGSLGTEAISSVSIINIFIQAFNCIIFGAVAAAGIFTAQYHGAGDTENVRNTFRVKLMMNFGIAAIMILLMSFFNDKAISLFLHTSDSTGDLAKTMELGKDYLAVILVGLIPYAISQAYASTLRETRQVMLPTYAGLVAVATNFVLNVVLIFGLLGFPALGVVGAAIATTISRFAELLFLMICVHKNSEKYTFIRGAYKSFKVSANLLAQIARKGLPLLINEVLWSTAMALRSQCISTRGLDAVAAVNIQNTIYNVMVIAYIALANSIAIIVGNMLGAGKSEEAIDSNRKLLTFAFLMGILMGSLQIAISPIFPKLYNTTESVRSLATYMMIISGISMPMGSLALSCYYTLRSGGLALLTMLFDCGYACVFTVPIGYILAFGFNANIYALFAIVTIVEAAKGILGLVLISKVKWARKLTL